MSRASHDGGFHNGRPEHDGAPPRFDRGDDLGRAALTIVDALQSIAERDRRVHDALRTLAGALTSGESRGRFSPDGRPERTEIDLALVAQRSRVKAEACRWVVERRRRMIETTESEDSLRNTDMDLINRARDVRGCWLWMLQPGEATPPDALMRNMVDVYTALAEAMDLALALGLDDGPGELDEGLVSRVYHLIAEAQSSLWAGLQLAGVQRDQDQIDAFVWLRERTREQRVYIERHMRREDPADPAQAADMLERLRAMAAEAGQSA